MIDGDIPESGGKLMVGVIPSQQVDGFGTRLMWPLGLHACALLCARRPRTVFLAFKLPGSLLNRF